MLEVRQDAHEVSLRGNVYELILPATEPWHAQLRIKGQVAADLVVPSACDTVGGIDATESISAPRIEIAPEFVTITVPAISRQWGPVSHIFKGSPLALEYYSQRQGKHSLDRLHYFFGRRADNSEISSRGQWTTVFDPEPNAMRKHYFLPSEHARIGIPSDRSYYRGNWLFSPGPLCFILRLSEDTWLGAGIVARAGDHNFDQFEYNGQHESFSLDLRYDGHVDTPAVWESPHLVLLCRPDEYAVLDSYCGTVRNTALPPSGRKHTQTWWYQPIFCGWGEQVALEQRASIANLPSVMAADHCTQTNYDRFLTILEEKEVAPGTLVLDDKWQNAYGLNGADEYKWPDLSGFIARQHAAGRHVLLWLRAWHPEGVPLDECLLDSNGRPLAVDPSSPAYQMRLRGQVRYMLEDLGADGFKIDFTHCLPRERGIRAHGGQWGIELLKQLITIVHDEAKRVKADALIMTHTANPYFADAVDMLRLNDIGNVIGQPSYLESMLQRARVARLSSPEWIIDTDNWPSPNRAAWLEYTRRQPDLGVPSLYYVSKVYYLSQDDKVTDEPLLAEDYREIASLWASYRDSLRSESN